MKTTSITQEQKTARRNMTVEITDISESWMPCIEGSATEKRKFLTAVFATILDNLGFPVLGDTCVELIPELGVILADIDVPFKDAVEKTFGTSDPKELYAMFVTQTS